MGGRLGRAATSRAAGSGVTRPRRRRLGVSAIIACLLLISVLPASGVEGVTQPVLRGYLDRYPADVAKRLGVDDLKAATQDFGLNAAGTVLFDPGLDRGYQLWTFRDLEQPSGMSVAVGEVDLATLTVGRLVKIPDRGLALPGPGTVGMEFLSTIDTKNHTLYLQTERGGGFMGAANRPEIAAIDLRSLTYTLNELPGLIESGFGAATIFSLEFDEISDNLIILMPTMEGSPGLTANPVTIIGWPAAQFDGGPLPGAGGMLGPRVLRNCRRDPVNSVPLNTDISAPIMITRQPDIEDDLAVKTWVFIPCMTTPVSANGAITRLNHATLFDRNASDERLIPAPPGVTNWAVDAKRGRMLLVNESEGSDGWVYEAATNSYIGVIQVSGSPAGRLTGFGVDEATGRLYAFNLSNGLMIAEMGQDPIPQADTYRLNPAGSGWPIRLDMKRNRIFAVPGTSERADRYEIYEVPAARDFEVKSEPDSLTKQVKEEAGRTTAQYGGSATAYGVRSLLAGGMMGAIPNMGNDNIGRVIKEVNTRCGMKDREVVLAAIQQTELQNSGREAKASGAYLDNASVQDLERPSRCDIYNEVGLGFSLLGVEKAVETLQFSSLYGRMDETLPGPYPGQPERGYADFADETLGDDTKWEYQAATCSRSRAVPGHNSDQLAGPTSVSCDRPGLVTAQSEGRARQDAIGTLTVSVGRAYTETSVKLDGTKGMLSEASAVVENFKIGPVTIGYIENNATSFAKGRTGTAGTSEYRPIVAGVRGPGISGCELRCDIGAVIPMLNTALAGRAEFRTLRPDPVLRQGSPGGYQSGIIKSEKQRSSDNALVGDKSGEVPALEVIIYNDNPRLGRIRQLIQLAGVHVDSQYGIQLFDDGTPCPECAGLLGFADELGDDVFADPGSVDVEGVGDGSGPIMRLVRKVIGGIAEGIQVLLANPREAGVVATVWALLLGPYVVWRRRRLLAALGN